MENNFFIIACAFIVLVTGCSTRPNVHLYERYLSEEESSRITKKLKEVGFNIKTNKLRFPTNITQTTIIYSPLLNEASSLDLLSDTLNSLDVKIDSVKSLFSGNHWYTKNSLAVFIVPVEGTLEDTFMNKDLTNAFSSKNCNAQMTLSLFDDGKYTLTSEYSDNGNPLLSSGTWHYRQHPYIELRPLKGEIRYQYYEISREIEQDQISKIEMLKLTALQSQQVVDGCTFEFGTRFH